MCIRDRLCLLSRNVGKVLTHTFITKEIWGSAWDNDVADVYKRQVLAAIIYNALVIIALIPLALKGVAYREVSAGKLLTRNLLIYGLGGIVTPFICIKLIDMLLAALGLI